MRPIGQKVEGGTATKAAKEPELQSLGRKVQQAIPAFLRSLPKKGHCLKGKLNINMFYWMKSSRLVKMRKDSIRDLQKYADADDGKMDYTSISNSIRNDLFRGHTLPRDVQAWPDLMLDDPFKHSYLIRYNVSLLHRRSKLHHFLSLYEMLYQVRKLSHSDAESCAKYYSVVDNIPAGATTPLYVWGSFASDNKYVEKVYNYRRGRSGSVFGLLTFVKDCIHHLLDYSVENNVAMFNGLNKYLMIQTCFQGVFFISFKRPWLKLDLWTPSLEEDM